MYCDSATVAYRKIGVNPDTGKNYKPVRYFKFSSDDALYKAYYSCPSGYEALLLPCNRCMLCTGRYRRHWVLRCQHELVFHDQSCFLTLTVNDDNLDRLFPKLSRMMVSHDFKRTWLESSKFNSLCHKPFQDFLKRLRVTLDRRCPGHSKIRYYMCGEYGDTFHRPHYHAIIFGFCPGDLMALVARPGLFTSPMLAKLWSFGFHTVSKVDPACISYVAGYVDKKMDESRMQWVDNFVAPEYTCMSRNPGLGGEFWNQFHDTDLYPENVDGTFPRIYACLGKNGRVKMPSFYDNLLACHDPDKYARLLAFRKVAVSETSIDLVEWLNESHRRCAVAVERRRQRETGVMTQVDPGVLPAHNR